MVLTHPWNGHSWTASAQLQRSYNPMRVSPLAAHCDLLCLVLWPKNRDSPSRVQSTLWTAWPLLLTQTIWLTVGFPLSLGSAIWLGSSGLGGTSTQAIPAAFSAITSLKIIAKSLFRFMFFERGSTTPTFWECPFCLEARWRRATCRCDHGLGYYRE